MISTAFILIGKILLMFLIIGGMIMILMGIGHLFRNDDLNTSEDDIQLRNDVEKGEDVVSEKSVFYNFLVKEQKNKYDKIKDKHRSDE